MLVELILWSVSNMLLVLTITFVIITIHGVLCVQQAHFSLSDWNDISIAHVIIVIKSEVSTLPTVIIFPWLCAWDVRHIIFCHVFHLHSGKTGILVLLLLCSLWWAKIVGYVLDCRLCSFVCTLHHLIIMIVRTYLKTLHFIIVQTWKYWTYKMPGRYIFRVCE